MKIQNKKTKTAMTILTTLAIGLVMLSPTTIIPDVDAQTASPINDNCRENSEKITHSKEGQFDFSLAKAAVTGSSTFQSMVKGYTYTYDSVNDDWTIGKADCSLTWNSINVIYSLYDSHGIVKNIEFSIDPQTTKIIKVREYVPAKSNISNLLSPVWSGYEFAGTSQISSSGPKIYKAFESYTQPQVAKPSDSIWGSNACATNIGDPACDVDTWVGLEGGQGGSIGSTAELVQSGTHGIVQCTPSCSTTYYAWYEFLPNNEQQCTGTIGAGSDTIDVTVENDAINPGGNSGKYDITTTDTSTGSLCSVPATAYSMTPVAAPYIVERFTSSLCTANTNNDCTLGVPTTGFTNTVTYSGTITYSNGTSQSIYTPWNDGYYVSDTMQNPATSSGTQNMDNGQVLSSGQFTVSYLSSGGT
ncbi:MAG: hypothetical protein KGL95_06475, partial [Patescibacteria group bacterium]|nr:hypothetical protein [Patescibacteria group bacterium]